VLTVLTTNMAAEPIVMFSALPEVSEERGRWISKRREGSTPG
jgi:hypothetical protein